MKYGRPVLLLAALLCVYTGTGTAELMAATAQQQAQHSVTGSVTDNRLGGPLGDVLVSVKGTQVSAATDQNGRYQIVAGSAQDTLVFTRLGMQPREVAIQGRRTVDVVLDVSAIELEQITVLGYQTVQRDRLTAAVSVVNVDQLRNVPTVSPMQALQGRVAGVLVTGGAEPGQGSTVRVRGISTLGNNDPLYVIDGIPTTGPAAQRLNPDDIESIQVLRDAASASIFGSRASNGVIVITTKSAASQRFSMTYSADVTLSSYANRPEVLNTEERGRALWQAAVNDGRDPAELPIYDYEWTRDANNNPVLNRVIIPEYVGDPAAGIRASDSDWYELSTRQGVIKDQRLSLRADGDRGGVVMSVGWNDNVGIVKGTESRQLNGRLNSTFNFLDGRLTIGENLSIVQRRTRPNPTIDQNPLQASLRAQPILPVYTESGGWAGPLGAGFDDRNHPLLWIHLNRWNRDYGTEIFGNVFTNLRVTPNLLATARFGIDRNSGENLRILPKYQAGFMSRTVNSINNTNSSSFEWTFNSTLNYSLMKGPHTATVLGGVEAVRNQFSNRGTAREDFAINDSRDFYVESAGSGPQIVSGSRGGFSLLSSFGKVDYDFGNRYLASFLVRRDGSSRFGADNRYGVFPAFALAWRLTNESFFPTGIFTDLKLRYSWGKTGNQQIANDATFSLFGTTYNSTAYDLGGVDQGTLFSGFVRTQTGNPRLRWEETAEANYGIDFSFLDNRFTGAFDYFKRTTSDILIRPAVLAVIGEGGTLWLNGATMETTGGELTMGFRDNLGGLNLNITANVGHTDDRITELPASVVGTYPGNTEKNILGRSVNSIFGYVADGLFQNQAEVDAHATQPGKRVGRIRYRDLNGDGIINALDQDYHGDTNPDVEYGLNTSLGYGRFDLNVFVQGVLGRKVNNRNKENTDFVGIWPGANWNRYVLEAWTPQNPNAKIPALSLSDQNNELRQSTYFVEDGDYLKVREVVLGYRLPSLPLIRAQEVRVYARVGNLWTWALGETTLLDPEFTQNEYPQPRNITFGVTTTF